MKSHLAIEILLLIHAFMTWMMVGIIFFVQAVYLPLYRRHCERFSVYDKNDLIHMGYLIGPVHLIESLSAIILAFMWSENHLYRIFAYINVGLMVLIWVVNWLLRMTNRNASGPLFIHKMHRILLTSNWFRTVCWTLRGFAVLMMLLFSNLRF